MADIFDDAQLQIIVSALTDTNWEPRRTAEAQLIQMKDARIVPLVLPLLNRTESLARSSAARVLGALGDARAVEPLFGLATNRAVGWTVRDAALTALSTLNAAGITKTLLALISDPSEEEFSRFSAAHILIKRGNTECYEAIVRLTQAPSPLTREVATFILSEWQIEDALPLLRRLTYDPAPMVSLRAAVGLVTSGDREVLTVLYEHVHDSDFLVREAAVTCIGEVGDTTSTMILIDALNDSDNSVVGAAIEALREIGDARAIPALQKVSKTYKPPRMCFRLPQSVEDTIKAIAARTGVTIPPEMDEA